MKMSHITAAAIDGNVELPENQELGATPGPIRWILAVPRLRLLQIDAASPCRWRPEPLGRSLNVKDAQMIIIIIIF